MFLDAVSNVTIQNDIIENSIHFGVLSRDYSGVSTGNLLSHDYIHNVLGEHDYGYGDAIYLVDNSYTNVQDNTISNVRRGLQMTNFFQANVGNAPLVISGNSVDSGQAGLWINNNWGPTSPVQITGNTLASSFVARRLACRTM